MSLVGVDHIQLTMPPGNEARASQFYGQLLGLEEIEKPSAFLKSGGCWFNGPNFQLHLGVEADFVPAKKAHTAFLVTDLAAFVQKMAEHGYPFTPDPRVAGRQRGYLHDPFGNRLEFMQDGDGFLQRPEIN